MKILIYWFKSNSSIYFYLVLNKSWKLYLSEQSLTGLGPEEWCSSWGLLYCLSFLDLQPFDVIKLLFIQQNVNSIQTRYIMCFISDFMWSIFTRHCGSVSIFSGSYIVIAQTPTLHLENKLFWNLTNKSNLVQMLSYCCKFNPSSGYLKNSWY